MLLVKPKKEYGLGSLVDAKLALGGIASCFAALLLLFCINLIGENPVPSILIKAGFLLLLIFSIPYLVTYYQIKKNAKNLYTDQEIVNIKRERIVTPIYVSLILAIFVCLQKYPVFYFNNACKYILHGWCFFLLAYFIFCYYYQGKKYQEYLKVKEA